MKIHAITAIICTLLQPLLAQDADIGRKIYSANAQSVLLLYVRAPNGEYVAQGSGFLVDGSRIVTNAHVATGGNVYIELGPARIPTTLEKLDSINDLAILTVNIEITAKPLRLSDAKPSPGDLIFAITNPEGLERTISQGVVSAERTVATRKLLQISTPISHGSSGGPIFNQQGQVIGIAVGVFPDGQNLNFAVPVEQLKDLLARQSSTDSSDWAAIAGQVTLLQNQQLEEEYSDAPESAYQKKQTQLESLLNKGVASAGRNPETLVEIAKLAQNINTDIALEAARRAVQSRPSSDAYLLLAAILNSKYIWSESDAKGSLMREAEEATRSAIKLARAPSAEMYYRLGDVLEDQGRYADAEIVLRKVLSLAKAESSGWYAQTIRDLILCAAGLNHLADEKHWFAELEKSGFASAYDWHAQAGRLYNSSEYQASGDAYLRAASTYKKDWCYAATMYSLALNTDTSLSANRKCIEVLTGVEGSELQLASAHESIADILNDRGVYSEALSHAKEAATLDPSNAFAFSAEAEALNHLQRFNEAINAAKEALRLSDGKYASMHFILGSSYFSVENWELARQSFEKAAELNPKDESAAYNVAICFVRLSYFNDAAHWYEEVLRRNPNRTDRDELKRRIGTLRR